MLPSFSDFQIYQPQLAECGARYELDGTADALRALLADLGLFQIGRILSPVIGFVSFLLPESLIIPLPHMTVLIMHVG